MELSNSFELLVGNVCSCAHAHVQIVICFNAAGVQALPFAASVHMDGPPRSLVPHFGKLIFMCLNLSPGALLAAEIVSSSTFLLSVRRTHKISGERSPRPLARKLVTRKAP